MVPVTGPAADVGKREAIGVQAAVDVINGKGGADGKPLKLYFADEGSNPQEAISAVRQGQSALRVPQHADRGHSAGQGRQAFEC